jgi:hypothetical protein
VTEIFVPEARSISRSGSVTAMESCFGADDNQAKVAKIVKPITPSKRNLVPLKWMRIGKPLLVLLSI